MYDEAIEVYDDEDDDENEFSYPSKPGLSPVKAPLASLSRRQIHGSGNMADSKMIPEKSSGEKTLSSQDFITARPPTSLSSSQRQGSSNISKGDPKEGSGAFTRRMSAQKPLSSDDEGIGRKPSSKSRPMSAQRRGPQSENEEDDDDDEDYDDDLNVAQIEGHVRRTLCNAQENEDSESEDYSIYDDNFRSNSVAINQFSDTHEDYPMSMMPNPIFDDPIPYPMDLYAHPPIHSPADMQGFLELRRLWELQIEMKRNQIGHFIRSNEPIAGVHDFIQQIYNPDDYDNLNVSSDVKEIFEYIKQYVPPPLNSQVEVKLHPFIPEYYPSVGDIDAFIKVVDSSVKDDGLGVKCLDEPAPFQSDPSVLDLRLRALAKQSSAKAVVVKKVENVGKNTKIIENWIKDISDLHRSKPSPSVHYSKPMPDLDLLIQEWPPEFEDLLKNITLPSPDLNCDLATYADIVCSLLDIPVYKSRIQSLHVLFTLYATQKQFSQYGGLGDGDNGGGLNNMELRPSASSIRRGDEVDHLQLS